MPPSTAQQIGQAIIDLNPYAGTQVMLSEGVEIDAPENGLLWYFKTGTNRVRKAVRVKFTYDVKNAAGATVATVNDWILIGYEGGGAY